MISNKKAKTTLCQPGFWDRAFLERYSYCKPKVNNKVIVVVDSLGYGYIPTTKQK